MLIETPVETSRLILRPETEADAESIYRMNTDAAVMRYVGDGRPWTWSLDEFRQKLRNNICRLAPEKYGFVAVTLKGSGQFIGDCWLAPGKYLEDLELGYRYISQAWGHGYATEAGAAILQAGFARIGVPRFAAMAHPDNPASLRVLEKLGFRQTGTLFHAEHGCYVPHFILERAAFEAHHGCHTTP